MPASFEIIDRAERGIYGEHKNRFNHDLLILWSFISRLGATNILCCTHKDKNITLTTHLTFSHSVETPRRTTGLPGATHTGIIPQWAGD